MTACLPPTNRLRASRLVKRELLQLSTWLRTLRLAQKHRRWSPSSAWQCRRPTSTPVEHRHDRDDGEHVRGEAEADTDVDPEPHEKRQRGRYDDQEHQATTTVDPPGYLGTY